MSVEFFCDFGNVGIDLSDEKHIRHRLQPVSSSEQLQEQLDLFKHALESGQRAKGSITVIALPNVCGVAEISAVHHLRRSLFSKTLKENRFYLLLTRYVGEELQMYEKVTDNAEQLKNLFSEFIDCKKVPDLHDWKCILHA